MLPTMSSYEVYSVLEATHTFDVPVNGACDDFV